MTGDAVTFALLSLSSIIIIVNPLGATLTYVTLTAGMNPLTRRDVAKESCRYALLILIAFALMGGLILQVFGITIDAFRIGGGILLFVIGMEMVYARTSRTKLTATEKYESMEAEDISVTPLAIPMIAGPGAITTIIVLVSEAAGSFPDIAMIIISILAAVLLTYLMMIRSDTIVSRIGQKEFRAINRLMGMLLIAIAVQFVINGLVSAFPALSG
ncbi:MAG TPA: NAAT family transporter [Methanoregulaceae archaeon]|nr:MAG: NAAT family transporter [Methanolinea sp.]HON81053.1 NAAT family transporter [Methanoregulaceae archaeon]HPD10252.1 NAAT family transporter [Methanoregulaceae archaeon]HRT14639.1 NAAT family transporter [Methanoregulaceae archaeon]HRU30210.1 NAAT family transporter [Methanoregulaceae archaeon]